MALLADAVERRGYDHAAGFGLMNAAWSPGFAIGAGVGAVVASAFGDAATFVGISALCLLSVLLLRSRVMNAEVVPEAVL
jgi:predicted MFS family arabinose efflux permease